MADRTWVVSAARSPTTSPWPRTARIFSGAILPVTLTLTQPESMIITWEVSSPARHSTAPARKTSSTPAAASASRSGSASAFQKLRAVGRSQRTLPAVTGTSATWPASVTELAGSDPSSRFTVSPSLNR